MKPIEIQQIENVSITITDEIKDAAEIALMSGQFIKTVNDEKTQAAAIKAVKTLKEITSAVEKARQECKRPFLEKGRELDRIAKNFVDPLLDEQSRITAVMNKYTVEQARIAREAEEKRQAEIRKAEEEKRKALEAAAKAKSEEEKEAAAQKVAQTIQAKQEIRQSSPPAPMKPSGVQVKREIIVTVEDPKALFLARPELCDLTPKLALIKECIKDGQELPGVTHKIEEKTIIRK